MQPGPVEGWTGIMSWRLSCVSSDDDSDGPPKTKPRKCSKKSPRCGTTSSSFLGTDTVKPFAFPPVVAVGCPLTLWNAQIENETEAKVSSDDDSDGPPKTKPRKCSKKSPRCGTTSSSFLGTDTVKPFAFPPVVAVGCPLTLWNAQIENETEAKVSSDDDSDGPPKTKPRKCSKKSPRCGTTSSSFLGTDTVKPFAFPPVVTAGSVLPSWNARKENETEAKDPTTSRH
ncbi:hypothetical protein NDU88_012030 [Pleurodeles waltl]|uniref:Uncharacterized protein n=1 Tax=Pleurodeles waltl TaxID=8319 RepID=A0AAV7S8J7_PLEWA|nr:hypothetical protein NDU88_012030 [Pleurodeles waltl]